MITFIPPSRRPVPIAVARKAVRALPLLAVMAIAGQVASGSDVPRRPSSPPTQASKTIVDRAVQPAGGGCRQCGPTGCKHGHHRDCRDGACVPYCPVRPSTFGFYGTQWRRWPGSGVVPVSNEQASTPVKPPKSSVPGPDEESLGPKASELPEPDFPAEGTGKAEADDARAASPARPLTPERPSPAAEPQTPTAPEDSTPLAPEPEAATPRPDEATPAQAEPAAPAPRPQDDNLFDESAAGRVRRKIPVATGPRPVQVAPKARRAASGRVQPATHQQAVPTPRAAAAPRPTSPAVPRVAFDPRMDAEGARRPVR